MVKFQKKAALQYEQIDPIVIDNIKEAIKNPVKAPKGMKLQSFVTYDGDDAEQTNEFHKRHILMSALFQKENHLVDANTGAELYMFPGIIEQLGRLPKIGDRFKVYRGDAYLEIITGTAQMVSMFNVKVFPSE